MHGHKLWASPTDIADINRADINRTGLIFSLDWGPHQLIDADAVPMRISAVFI